MRTFLGLIVLQFKQQYRPGVAGRGKPGRTVLLLLALIPFGAMLYSLFGALTRAGVVFGVPALGIELAILGGMLAAVAFGVSYVVSTLYYGRDINLLLPLPLPPNSILFAKFALVAFGELATLAIFYWPAVAAYGVISNAGLGFWLLSVAFFLILPVIPLCLATLLTMVLMTVTSGRLNRDALRVGLGLVMMLLVIGLQALQRFAIGNSLGGALTPEGLRAVQALLSDGKLNAVGRFFPPSVWATRGLTGDGPSAALFLIAVVGAALITALVAQRLLFRGLIGVEDKHSPTRRLSGEELRSRSARVSSPALAVFSREVKQFNRTPVFLTQALTPFLISPAYILTPLLASGGIKATLAGLTSLRIDGRTAIIALGILQFMTITNPIGATAFSRDGHSFWYGRTLPLLPADEVKGKLLHILSWSGLFIAVANGLLFALYRPGVALGAAFIAANLAGATAAAEIGMLTDIRAPRLDWIDPKQAFRGNSNALVTTLLSVLALLAVGVPLAVIFRGSALLACLVAALLLALLALGLFPHLVRVTEQAFRDLQE